MGHPDKLADQISDSILDAILAQDPTSRVACETLVTTGLALIAGEITTKAIVNYADVVRAAILAVGYDDDESGISGKTCNVMVALDKQSPDIAMGVNDDSAAGKDIGAGDQGLMFGYACTDTPELMPLAIALSHRITNRLTEARFNKEVDWLRPDSKSQVTIEYDGFTPTAVNTVVVSTQHAPGVTQQQIHQTRVAASPGQRRDHLSHQSNWTIHCRWSSWRLRTNRSKDHRGYLRRMGTSRRWCLQR
jgi:S-adenosylmethionine synthetase